MSTHKENLIYFMKELYDFEIPSEYLIKLENDFKYLNDTIHVKYGSWEHIPERDNHFNAIMEKVVKDHKLV